MTQGWILLADELKLTTAEELETWLQDKPTEWGYVIGIRSALRILPFVGHVYQFDNLKSTDLDQLILTTFRVCLLPLAAYKYPTEDITVGAASAVDVARTANSSVATLAIDAAFVGNAASIAAFADSSDIITANTADVLNTISRDANWLVSRDEKSDAAEQARQLAEKRLWPDSEPERVLGDWQILISNLLKLSPYHQVWINWYSNVLNGKPFFELSPDREKALTLKIAKQENEFWEQDFAKVSEDISGWLNDARIEDARRRDAKNPNSHELDQWKVDLLEIPLPHPATLEPEWQNGRLNLPTAPLDDDLKIASIESALAALKNDFLEFNEDISSELNIDQRATAYLAKISADIPTTPPPQDQLFSLAHKEQFFVGYAKTVSEEWPEFLAARFHALGLQFSRVMKQFPEWREFKANADQKQFTSDEIEKIEQLAIAMEQSLREELAIDFVDQNIADVVAEMAGQVKPESESISPEQADALVQSGKDLLAADLLTSIDNIVKRIAEALLAAKGHAFKFAKYSGMQFGSAVKKEYEVQLKKLGKGFVKWGFRVLKSSPIIILIQSNFPTIYSWLEPILKLIF